MQFPGHSRLAAIYLAVCLAGLGAACAAFSQKTTPVPPPSGGDARLQQYKHEVEPILQANCLRCHGGMNRRGGLSLSTRAGLLQGGKDGVVVVPGRPEDSLLMRVVSPGLSESDPMRMPPKGTRLRDADVMVLRKWVADGLVMDR